MSECEHEWHFYEESKDGCFCVKGCRGRLSRAEAEVMLNEHATLKREIDGLRKLAYDYIQAYEKLAFGDALLTPQEKTS